MEKQRLLLVEDDENLGYVVSDNLSLAGYSVTHETNGELAWVRLQKETFDLCILDVMLPQLDGFSLAERIRQHKPDQAFLFLTARNQKEDRIAGLGLGADDYVCKPFSIEELLLRIKAILRRTQSLSEVEPNKTMVYRPLPELWFDFNNLKLKVQETQYSLTQKEADLLKLFLDHPNTLLRRDFILLRLWGEDDYFLGRSLDVFISRLRKLLQPLTQVQLKNLHGVGFCLEIDLSDSELTKE